MEFFKDFFKKSTEQNGEIIHADFSLRKGNRFHNREISPIDGNIDIKARVGFDDVTLLNSFPFLAKITLNTDPTISSKYIGIIYGNTKKDSQQFLKLIKIFPYAELINNLNENGESTKDSLVKILSSSHKENTLEHPIYDADLSEKYQDEGRLGNPHQFMAYTTWLDEIGNIQEKNVLDLACGSGDSSRMLAEKGAQVVGADISEEMVNIAKMKQDENIEYVVADASIPTQYKEFLFDKVVAAFLLNYANSLEKLDGMLQNISMNLKSGSEFVTITISPDHPIILPGKHISHSTEWIGEGWKDGSTIHTTLRTKEGNKICDFNGVYWTKETYEKILKKNGFQHIEWIELTMCEEGKSLDNWKDIEKKNMLVVIKAIKE